MRKIFAVLLLLSLLLSGCVRPSQQTPTAPPPVVAPTKPTQEPVPNAPVYTQQQMLAVSVPAKTEYVTDDSGSLLFTHTFQTLQLILQDPEVADKIIIDFLSRIDESHSQAEWIHLRAIDDAPLAVPYTFQIVYNPMRIDRNVLSLFGTTVSYSGGVHPDSNCTAANYSMVTGDVLTLGSILTNVDAIDPLYQLILDALEENKEAYQLMGGYAQIVHERLFSEESYYEDWYFSPTGLCFIFPPYEIAPYASGIITVEIPYKDLAGIIGDGFFPTETDHAVGQIYAVRRTDADLSKFTQIAEVIVDAGGESFLMYTDTTVYDIRLEIGTWNEDATVFTPSYTAFAARSLTPGDAIMAQVYFPDVLPVLRLTYTSGMEIKTFFIEQSGMDGSILLTPQ